MKSNGALMQIELPGIPALYNGKVRAMFPAGRERGDDTLVIATTDRISAYDVVMADPIPDKGKILNQMTKFWFETLPMFTQNHFITTHIDGFPLVFHQHARMLKGRSMLVWKREPLVIECVVRGYISGSGWTSYLENGTVCGIKIPSGLKESDRLTRPLYTPSTKAGPGQHDEYISFDRTVELLGGELAEAVRDAAVNLYIVGAKRAEEKGIIIADTKFEFGLKDGVLYLIDEVLTPDSSRFWPMDSYQPGGPQVSFDKQFLRDWLKSIRWKAEMPPPELPVDVVADTRLKYIEAFRWLTGNEPEL